MSIIIDILEIVIALIILTIIGKYLVYTESILTMFLPPIILKFILLAIAISVVQYIISRKDD